MTLVVALAVIGLLLAAGAVSLAIVCRRRLRYGSFHAFAPPLFRAVLCRPPCRGRREKT